MRVCTVMELVGVNLRTPERTIFPMLNLPFRSRQCASGPGSWDSRTASGICGAAACLASRAPLSRVRVQPQLEIDLRNGFEARDRRCDNNRIVVPLWPWLPVT